MKTPVENLILYFDIFLLTFAIGINAHRAIMLHNAPVVYERSGGE